MKEKINASVTLPLSNLNININKDDESINDYLYCWNIIGKRPCRTKLHASYDSEKILNYLSNNSKEENLFVEVIPASDDYIVNEKSLSKFDDGIFITITHFDKMIDDSIISDVEIFYNIDSKEKVNKIIDDISDFELNIAEENSLQRINTLNYSQNGLDLESLDLMMADYDNIDNYFNGVTIKKADKLTKVIKKTPKGLSIIHGERGNGKTTLVNWISSNLDKVVIFIPSTMIEMTINNPEFRTFLKRYKNSVLIIDDSELYLSEIYSKSNIFTNNLLQLVDGFQSDSFNLNIILVCNCDLSELDHSLIDSNNLLDIIEVAPLSKCKSVQLASSLSIKAKFKSDTKVVDVLKKRNFKNTEIEIGFI